MAVYTVHPPLAEVHIGLNIFVFTEILISYPASMTSRAIASHGRFLLEYMTFNQTPTDRVRLADMTVATSCVAAGTVIAKHFFQWWVVSRCTARFNCGPVSRLSGM
jgi:hypothetical protein